MIYLYNANIYNDKSYDNFDIKIIILIHTYSNFDL